MNINERLQTLLNEVKKVNVSNDKFKEFGSSFVNIPVLESMAAKIHLSDELLSLATSIAERVSIQSELNHLIDKSIAAYHLTVDSKFPSWLVRSGTDSEVFTEFFASFGAYENPNFYGEVESYTGKNPTSAFSQYQKWKEFVVLEEKKKEQSDLVRHAVDLESLLNSILRTYGYGSPKAEELVG